MHDPRVGRFFAVDPLASKYPHNSVYAFSENRVIDGVELEGLEYQFYMTNIDNEGDIQLVKVDELDAKINVLFGLYEHDANLEKGVFVYGTDGNWHRMPEQFENQSLNIDRTNEEVYSLIDSWEVDNAPFLGKNIGEALQYMGGTVGAVMTHLAGNGLLRQSPKIKTKALTGKLVKPKTIGAKARKGAKVPLADDMPSSTNKVQKVNGRYPINSKYAGRIFKFKEGSALEMKYPKGVEFNEAGFPDFSPYARKTVDIGKLNKSSSTDFSNANKLAGFKETPSRYTWHHVENSTKLQLVPTDLHTAVRHTGGRATNAP